MIRLRTIGVSIVLIAVVLASGCPAPRNSVRIKIVNDTSNFYGARLYLSQGTVESPPIATVSENLLLSDVDPTDSAQVEVSIAKIDETNANSITFTVQNAAATLETNWTISAGGFEGGTQYTLTMTNSGDGHSVALTKQ